MELTDDADGVTLVAEMQIDRKNTVQMGFFLSYLENTTRLSLEGFIIP